MKKYKYFLITTLSLFPKYVFAATSSELPLSGAFLMEAFVTLHMTVGVISPFSKIVSIHNRKKVFWGLFLSRIALLLIFDFFITPMIAIVDFIFVFIGAMFIVPITRLIVNSKHRRESTMINNVNINNSTSNKNQNGIVLRCTKCNNILSVNHKFCANCGTAFDGNNVKVQFDPNLVQQPKKYVNSNDFDPMYKLTEYQLIEQFINKQLINAGIDKNSKLIPQEILKRKKILNLIFAILVFIYISLIFFHFPIATYIIGLIILIIFFIVSRRYSLVKYLIKQVKSRPSEKISNIVMSVKNTFTTDNSNIIFIPSLLCAIIIPAIIFMNPRIMYEEVDGGYAVRFYTFGITNFTNVTIPEEYKGEKIVSLRGNTFSNMYFLKEVKLPNTIVEIRGQAFKNNYSLTKVNIPANLEYLGGGAFYNCSSLTNVELPDSLTYLGGESFYGCNSLESIKLSSNLTEIKGSTFEYCDSLKTIDIPDKVIRIGGHAFYGDYSLEKVNISESSQLQEIGSSAFRMCDNLKEINIPSNTVVNGRAFKESPTIVKRYGVNNDYYDQYNYYN